MKSVNVPKILLSKKLKYTIACKLKELPVFIDENVRNLNRSIRIDVDKNAFFIHAPTPQLLHIKNILKKELRIHPEQVRTSDTTCYLFVPIHTINTDLLEMMYTTCLEQSNKWKLSKTNLPSLLSSQKQNFLISDWGDHVFIFHPKTMSKKNIQIMKSLKQIWKQQTQQH